MYALEYGNERVMVTGDLDAVAYRAALGAAHELPADVGALARRLAARGDEVPELGTVSTSFGGRVTPPAPWPDGPKRRVDRAFQKICLTTDAMVPLIQADPETAAEVLLALLIQPPSTRGPFESRMLQGERLDVEDILDWRAPLYTNGPFLAFLAMHRLSRST